MSDKELIARLRGWARDIQTGSTAIWAMDQDLKAAADRIEALLNLNEALERAMSDLKKYTDEDLLRELARRNKIVKGPTSRTIHDYEVLLGIGKDHHCYITFTDRDDVAALTGDTP